MLIVSPKTARPHRYSNSFWCFVFNKSKDFFSISSSISLISHFQQYRFKLIKCNILLPFSPNKNETSFWRRFSIVNIFVRVCLCVVFAF